MKFVWSAQCPKTNRATAIMQLHVLHSKEEARSSLYNRLIKMFKPHQFVGHMRWVPGDMQQYSK